MIITQKDKELIRAASELLRKLYHARRHRVAAAVRAGSGKIYAAVGINANLGRCDICAEAAAISKAVSEGEKIFESIAAVKYFPKRKRSALVAPCGVCREFISDFGPIKVIYSAAGSVRKEDVRRLLPNQYNKNGDG
ncbi:MAG: cytidine deaminase [Elusimicrobia bacterium]|nr:cytidine deaminase [Elusimicrobiota bacterium]